MKNFKILEHIEFGKVRTLIDEKGRVLFCGVDVARALGYATPHKAVDRHCKGDGMFHTVIDNLGRHQATKFIHEPDLYRLIIKSKLPAAALFESWVFETVIPIIRKYGMYATDELLENNEKFIEMKELLKAEQRASKLQKTKLTKLKKDYNALKEENTCLEDKNFRLANSNLVLNEILEENFDTIQEKNEIIETQKPLVDYLETILNSECPMTITQIAADYGISAMQLNNILHEARIQRKVNEQWVLYREYMNLGLTNSETIKLRNENKSIVVTKWTQAGRLLIHEVMTALRMEAYQISFDFTSCCS